MPMIIDDRWHTHTLTTHFVVVCKREPVNVTRFGRHVVGLEDAFQGWRRGKKGRKGGLKNGGC